REFHVSFCLSCFYTTSRGDFFAAIRAINLRFSKRSAQTEHIPNYCGGCDTSQRSDHADLQRPDREMRVEGPPVQALDDQQFLIIYASPSRVAAFRMHRQIVFTSAWDVAERSACSCLVREQ